MREENDNMRLCGTDPFAPGWQAVREGVGGHWARGLRPPNSDHAIAYSDTFEVDEFLEKRGM
jgi:hypothetical protein